MTPLNKADDKMSADIIQIVRKSQALKIMPNALAELTGIPIMRISNVINRMNPKPEDVKKLKQFLKI